MGSGNNPTTISAKAKPAIPPSKKCNTSSSDPISFVTNLTTLNIAKSKIPILISFLVLFLILSLPFLKFIFEQNYYIVFEQYSLTNAAIDNCIIAVITNV